MSQPSKSLPRGITHRLTDGIDLVKGGYAALRSMPSVPINNLSKVKCSKHFLPVAREMRPIFCEMFRLDQDSLFVIQFG